MSPEALTASAMRCLERLQPARRAMRISSRSSTANSSRCRCATVVGSIASQERFGLCNHDFFADSARDQLGQRARVAGNTLATASPTDDRDAPWPTAATPSRDPRAAPRRATVRATPRSRPRARRSRRSCSTGPSPAPAPATPASPAHPPPVRPRRRAAGRADSRAHQRTRSPTSVRTNGCAQHEQLARAGVAPPAPATARARARCHRSRTPRASALCGSIPIITVMTVLPSTV